MPELKHYTFHLYEGGITSSNQVPLIYKTSAINEQEAVLKALKEYPDSIITYSEKTS